MNPALVQMLIAMAPLALLVALLLFGRYPGEGAIERIRDLLSLSRYPNPAGPSARAICDWHLPVCGGRLVAATLAGRGPPRTQ